MGASLCAIYDVQQTDAYIVGPRVSDSRIERKPLQSALIKYRWELVHSNVLMKEAPTPPQKKTSALVEIQLDTNSSYWCPVGTITSYTITYQSPMVTETSVQLLFVIRIMSFIHKLSVHSQHRKYNQSNATGC